MKENPQESENVSNKDEIEETIIFQQINEEKDVVKKIEFQEAEKIFPQLPFASASVGIEETREAAEEKIEKEVKTVTIDIKEEDNLETASEIKFKTLFLNKFPIKYRNFSKSLVASKISNLGVTEVDFGFEKMPAVQIRLLDFPKFKMIELKKRDFKFSIGVATDGTILLRSNDLFEYEIQKDIKNTRLKLILEFLSKLFSGTSIKFHLGSVVCDLDFLNHIEEFKFNSILESLKNYEHLVTVYSLQKNRDLATVDNSFYDLLLLYSELITPSIDTWINLKIENKYNLEIGDKLVLNRLHKYNLKNLPFNLLEKIELKNPLGEKEIIGNFIKLNRKTVKITFEKINK